MAPRRRRLLLVVCGLVLLAALAAAWGMRALHGAVSPARARALLSDALGLEVRVGAVELSWLPPSLEVREVSAVPALGVGRARIDPSLAALLRARVEVGELHLEDAEVALLLREDGRLAFDTGAPGGVLLPAAGEEDGGLDAAPDLHLRRAALTLRHEAEDREPLRLEIAGLDFHRRPLLGARLDVRAGLGPEGRHGRLALRARAAGVAGLGGDPQDDPSLRLALEGRGLEALALGPWLPGSLPVRAGPGPLDLDLAIEGSRRDALATTVSLSKGTLAVGALELAAPARAEGRVAETPEGLRIEGATLEAASATTPWVRSGALRAGFGWKGGTLHVASVDVEDLRPGTRARNGAFPFGLDLHVGEARHLAVEGLAFGRDAPAMPRRVEARGIRATLERETEEDVPPLPLEVSRLVVEDLAPGRTARLALDAEGPEGGTLRVRGRYGPWSPEAPPLEQPLALDVTVGGVTADRVASLLPATWGVAADEAASLEMELGLEGPRADALAGPLKASLPRGRLQAGPVALTGPARMEGRLDLAGGRDAAAPPRLEAELQVAAAALDAARSGPGRARLAWRDGVLELRELELEQVETQGAPLRVGDPQGASIALDRAEGVSLQALRVPLGPDAAGPSLPARAEIRKGRATLAFGLRPGAPALALEVESLEARDLAPGARATLRLDGLLAEGGGRASGYAVLASFAPDAPILPQLRELAIELEDADADTVATQLPEGVAPEEATGRLDASVDLGPANGGAVAGTFRLVVREGVVRLAGLHLADPKLEARLAISKEGVPEVDDVTMRAAGGTWRQTGRLVLAETPFIEARIALEDVALYEAVDVETAAATARATPPVSPRVDATLDVSGPLPGGPERLTALRGEGLLTLRGGELASSELLWAVGQALARQVGMAARDGRRRPTPLETASLPLRLADGRLYSDDLTMSTREYVLRGKGYVALDGAVRLDTTVSFRPSGVTRIAGILDVTRPITGDLLRLPPIPVAIRGTLAEPRFEPSPARLPVAWARGLLRLPGTALDAVGGAARTLGEGVGRLIPGRADKDEEGEQAPSSAGDAEPSPPGADSTP